MSSNGQLTTWSLGELTYESKTRAAEFSSSSWSVYGVDRHDGLTPEAKYTAKDLGRYKVIGPGMFAYNPMRLNIGSIAFCSHRQNPGLVSPDYVVFGCRTDCLLPEYLAYVIRGPEWAQWTTAAGVGSVRVRIYYNELARMPLTLCPIEAQRRIAHILGTLDDRIELNRRMNETLEAIAQTIFKSWFVDFDPVRAKAAGRKPAGMDAATAALFPHSFEDSPLGKVPRGWAATTWGELITLEYGKSLRGYEDAAGDVPVYGTNGLIGWHTASLCHHEGIIIGRKGAYRGVHYSHRPFYVIDTAFFVRPRQHMELRWAYYAMCQIDLDGMDSGSAIPSTSRDQFYKLPVVQSPPSVQRAFVDRLAPVWRRQRANQAESQSLAAMRDTLLPKLLSGAIVLAEPVSSEDVASE